MSTVSGHIDVRDVNISFKARGAVVQAVKSVSLNVQPGEFVSLIGPSGCGKSDHYECGGGLHKGRQWRAVIGWKAHPWAGLPIAVSCSSSTRYSRG